MVFEGLPTTLEHAHNGHRLGQFMRWVGFWILDPREPGRDVKGRKMCTFPQSLLLTYHFSGPDRAIGLETMCLFVGTIISELNAPWFRYVARWSILALCRSRLKIQVSGHGRKMLLAWSVGATSSAANAFTVLLLADFLQIETFVFAVELQEHLERVCVMTGRAESGTDRVLRIKHKTCSY